MNRWIALPITGLLAAAAYGIYEFIDYDYDKESSRNPILPNWILENDPQAVLLSQSPEDSTNDTALDVRNSTEPTLTVSPTSATLSPQVVHPQTEPTPTTPETPQTPPVQRDSGTAANNTSTISSEKPSASSSAEQTSPISSSTTGLRNNTAPTSSEKKSDAYQVDNDWFKNVGKHSLAYKYKDNLLLVNGNHDVWKSKAEKLKKLAKDARGGLLWTYWGGYLYDKDLSPQFAHRFCRTALEYSEWTTFWTIGISKRYMDFLWTVCGRDDKSKPNDWWWR